MQTSLSLKKGNLIYRQGDGDSARMYDIQTGRIGLFEGYGTAGQTLLAELAAGDFFGEMDMIEGTPRSHTAAALEDTKLVPITAETFQEYFSTRPAKVLSIMRNMSRRTRLLTKRYMDLCRSIYEGRKAQ